MKSRVIFFGILFFSLSTLASDDLKENDLYENFNHLNNAVSSLKKYIQRRVLNLDEIKKPNDKLFNEKKRLYQKLEHVNNDLLYLETLKKSLVDYCYTYNSRKKNLQKTENLYKNVNCDLNRKEVEEAKKLFSEIESEFEAAKENINKEVLKIETTFVTIEQFKDDFDRDFDEFYRQVQNSKNFYIQNNEQKTKEQQRDFYSKFERRKFDKDLIFQLRSKVYDLEIPDRFDLPKKSKKNRIKVMKDLDDLGKFYDEICEGIREEKITIVDLEKYAKIFDFVYKESLEIYKDLDRQKIILKEQKEAQEVIDKIYILPDNFDFMNKSVSDMYVDLVMLDLIERGIRSVDDNDGNQVIGKINNSQKLKYYLKNNVSHEQKELVKRYIWQNRDKCKDLLHVFVEEKSFDNITGMLHHFNDLRNNNDLVGADEYKNKKSLDCQVFYFLEQQRKDILNLRLNYEISEDELRLYLREQYKGTEKNDIDLFLSYVKEFKEEQKFEITQNDIKIVGLEFQPTDSYFKEAIEVCMKLDTILHDETTMLSEKIQRYGNFIETSQYELCKNLRTCLKNPQVSLNFLQYNNQICSCYRDKNNCEHEGTYTFILQSIVNYFSLPQISHFHKKLLEKTHPDKNIGSEKEAETINKNLNGSSRAALELFEKMKKKHKVKTEFEKIALYNIIKHRSDLISDEVAHVSFKSVTKHLLIPCFKKIIKDGSFDKSYLEEILIQTRLVISDEQISKVLPITNYIINRKNTSEEIKNVLIDYNEKITKLKNKDKKRFDIWGFSLTEISKLSSDNVTYEENKKLQKINLLFDQNYDFVDSLKEVFFEDVLNYDDELLRELDELVENDSSEDQIEENKKYHAAKRRKEIKEAKDEVLSPLKGFLQQWALQKIMQKAQGDDLPPEFQAQQIKEFKEYDKHNESVHDMFYEGCCENEDLVQLHYQEKDKKLRNEYDVIQITKNFNTSLRGHELW